MNGGFIFFWEWEENFIASLQSLGASETLGAFLVWLNNAFSFLGEEYVAVGVMGIVYWGIDKKKGERIGLAVVASLVGNVLLKNIVRRVRPWASSDKVELLRDVDGYSFPSAHSSSATSLYPTLAAEYRKHKWLRVVAVVVPLLIAFSRCYLGAHWPTDVIAGLLMGLCFCILVEFVMPKIKNKYIVYIALIVIGFLGMFYCTTEDYFTNYGILLGFASGMFFEDKITKFENTKSIAFIALRTVCGGILFVLINTLIKLVLGGFFPEGSFSNLIFRTVRYAVIVFCVIGVYPMVFKPAESFLTKVFAKKGK